VVELQDVHVADGHRLRERRTGAAVEQLHLAGGLLALAAPLSTSMRMLPVCSSCQRTSASSTSLTVAPSNTGVAT